MLIAITNDSFNNNEIREFENSDIVNDEADIIEKIQYIILAIDVYK